MDGILTMSKLKNNFSEAVIPLRGPHNHENIMKLTRELVPLYHNESFENFLLKSN